MNERALRAALAPGALARLAALAALDETDSTNAEALRALDAGRAAPLLVAAGAQRAGRGRRGREWLSPRGPGRRSGAAATGTPRPGGSAIRVRAGPGPRGGEWLSPGGGAYLSLGHRTGGRNTGGLRGAAALAARSALAGLGAPGLAVKWPNDVLAGEAKLAGILLESRTVAAGRFTVFGVGVNLALPLALRARLGRPATDLAAALGRPPPPAETVAAAVAGELLDAVELHGREGFAAFRDRWNELDAHRGREVVLCRGARRLAGTHGGVGADGALLLETADGTERVTGGELSPSLRAEAAG